MSDNTKARERLAVEISRRLADEGKLIEAGWQVFRMLALHDERNVAQLDRYKDTWDSSAQHLFSTIFAILEDGVEETPADLRRMDNIKAEVDAIYRRLQLRFKRAKGSA
jgi:hypothetical protein